jgi:glycosyltransferase involved in cell wall biosynthesis
VKVLLLSAYAANSHVYWQDSLLALFPQWQWQVLALPPRHFSWRVRGNPLYWSIADRPTLEQDYDLLIATSMVDLATLRGLVPKLSAVPTVLYFHENQFVYPQDRQKHSLLEAQMVSLYSALAADSLLFNSDYNQRSFFEGCGDLLRRLPDMVPPGILEGLQRKSRVLPVPLKEVGEGGMQGRRWPGAKRQAPAKPLRLAWLGRFEHDKGGDGLKLILHELEKIELHYELALIGQQFRNSPPVFQEIERDFSHRLVQFGYLNSTADYRQYLEDADIVLSTALHEFQGLAVLEAVRAGCLPAVPNRLVYPEIFASEFCYPSLREDPASEALGAAQLITSLAYQLRQDTATVPTVTSFEAAALKPGYEQLFASLCPPV